MLANNDPDSELAAWVNEDACDFPSEAARTAARKRYEARLRADDPAMSATTRANGIRIAKDVLGAALKLLESRSLPAPTPSPTASSITS